MKKYFMFFLVLLSVCFISFIKDAGSETKVIRMMYFDNPPFIIFDQKTGSLSGATYDFIENYVAKETGIKFNWDKTSTPIPRQLSILAESDSTASATFIYTAERANSGIFSAKPYVTVGAVVVVSKHNTLDEVRSVEDIQNLKIGTGRAQFLPPLMKDKRLKLDVVSNPNFKEINFKKLQAKRLGAVYEPNKYATIYYLNNLKMKNEVKILDLPGKPSSIYILFSKKSGDTVKIYNQAFDKLDAANLYKRLLEKYINN